MFVCQGMATLILQKWAWKIQKSSAQKTREIEGINFTDNCLLLIYIPSSSVYNKNVMENVHVLINSFHEFFFGHDYLNFYVPTVWQWLQQEEYYEVGYAKKAL